LALIRSPKEVAVWMRISYFYIPSIWCGFEATDVLAGYDLCSGIPWVILLQLLWH